MTTATAGALAERTSAELIEEYLSDMKRSGRLLSVHSQSAYRRALELHAEDVGDVGLLASNRLHVKATLRRWEHPNSQRRNHAAIGSFYNWCCEEGYRETNPAAAVRKAKPRQPSVYRLTREEVQAMMAACRTERETRIVFLGLCTGARRAELVGLRGRHFAREGWVQIAADGGAKGMKERWIPVLPELEPIVAKIRARVGPDDPALTSSGPSTYSREALADDGDQAMALLEVSAAGERVRLPVEGDSGPGRREGRTEVLGAGGGDRVA